MKSTWQKNSWNTGPTLLALGRLTVRAISNTFNVLILSSCFCPNFIDNQGLMATPGHCLLLNRSMWRWTTTIEKKRWWSNPDSASFGTVFFLKYNVLQVRHAQIKQICNPHPSSHEIPIQIWCRRRFVRLSCGGVLPYLACGGELQYRSAPPLFKHSLGGLGGRRTGSVFLSLHTADMQDE